MTRIGNVPLTMSANTLTWRVDFTDSENHERTIKEYQIYSSADGANLTRIGTVQFGTGVHSLDVGPSGPTSRTQFYVRAVGQSNIQNFMSAPICYNSSQCIQISASAPVDYDAVSSPVHIGASATAAFSSVTKMEVYVDGALAFTANGASSLNTDVAMASGERFVSIKAWTATGDSFTRYRHVYVR